MPRVTWKARHTRAQLPRPEPFASTPVWRARSILCEDATARLSKLEDDSIVYCDMLIVSTCAASMKLARRLDAGERWGRSHR